jgi:hypothetical protein
MSWSISYAGKVKDAKKACRSSFKSQKQYYVGTAEGKILELARKLVVAGLKYQKPDATVNVVANGHAIQEYGMVDGTSVSTQVGQNLSVSVQLVA